MGDGSCVTWIRTYVGVVRPVRDGVRSTQPLPEELTQCRTLSGAVTYGCDLHDAAHEASGQGRKLGLQGVSVPYDAWPALFEANAPGARATREGSVRHGPGYTVSCTSTFRTIWMCHRIFKCMAEDQRCGNLTSIAISKRVSLWLL